MYFIQVNRYPKVFLQAGFRPTIGNYVVKTFPTEATALLSIKYVVDCLHRQKYCRKIYTISSDTVSNYVVLQSARLEQKITLHKTGIISRKNLGEDSFLFIYITIPQHAEYTKYCFFYSKTVI